MPKRIPHKEDRFINFILRKGQKRRSSLEGLYRIFLGLKQVSDDLVVLEKALNKSDMYLLKKLIFCFYNREDHKIIYPSKRSEFRDDTILLFCELVEYACDRMEIDQLFAPEDTDDDVVLALDIFLDNPKIVMLNLQSCAYFNSLVKNMLALIEEELEPKY